MVTMLTLQPEWSMSYDVSRMKYEYKYMVRNSMRDELRRLIAPFMEFDPYMELRRIGGAGEQMLGYTVRSIYYDTEDLRFYREKDDGIADRKKVRIRGYNEFGRNNIVFLELKHKHEKKIFKNRASVLYGDLDRLLESGDAESYVLKFGSRQEPLADAERFLFALRRDRLVPVVLVIYEREAYFGKFDNSFRITFDKNLRSSLTPSTGDLYEERGIRPHAEGWFVLEVKFYQTFPSWMTDVIRILDLKQQSFSKYTGCIDSHFTGRSVPRSLPVIHRTPLR